jgi:hypothetical protein
MDAGIDADLFPLALEDLFDQLARAVARGRRQLERQRFAVSVLARSARLRVPAGLFQ